MTHYFEIQLLPDAEFVPTLLMNVLYAKLHRVLATMQPFNIGVSFPGYAKKEKGVKASLGKVLRLHGTESDLQKLLDSSWFTGMNDHISVSKIYPVPDATKWWAVRRVQAMSNVDRLRRRQMRRHSLTEEEVIAKYPDTIKEKLALPFVSLKSQSTGGRLFRLFIQQEEINMLSPGSFNAYGLSQTATLPAFN